MFRCFSGCLLRSAGFLGAMLFAAAASACEPQAVAAFSAAKPGASQPDMDDLTRYTRGWGVDARNTRYQPNSRLDAANAGKLKLKWVHRLGSETPRSLPLITQQMIYVGNDTLGLLALDRESGCEQWRYPHQGQFGSAIIPVQVGGQPALIFNDRTQGMYAVNAHDGTLLWHFQLNDEPVPWYSGSPLIVAGVAYLPISSLEVGLAVNPFYGCCTTSGGLAAIDIDTGEQLWYVPTIKEEAKQTGSHYVFVEEFGPSGATVWAAPSYSEKHALVFFGTGQNYSHPTTDTSDAIFAVHAQSGEIAWINQYTENDAYNAACNVVSLNHPNCPDPLGPDVDFGAATILARTADGREMLIAGQKSAEVHAMDPATGAHIWTTRLGRGGIIGGVHWGMAVDESRGLLFVPNSDKAVQGFPSPGEPAPGLYGLDLASGEVQWHYARKSRCEDTECVLGYSAALTATNDVLIAGSMDGFLEILRGTTGELLWRHDAWRDYEAVSEDQPVVARGGAFDAHGAAVADNLLVINAGYRYVGEQRGGNALLVFELDDADPRSAGAATGSEQVSDHE